MRRSETTLLEAQRIAKMGSFARRVSGTDIRAHEITWSEGLYRIFEVERGTPVSFRMMEERIYPDDVPMWWDKIVSAQKASANFQAEIRLLMPRGATKHISINAYLTHDIEGKPEYIGTVQDITQRRLEEDAITKARSDLGNAMRVASLGVLTASIAHEVNQPLSGVNRNAATCLRMLKKEALDVQKVTETVQRILRDAHRVSDIMERLRSLFTRKSVQFELLDLSEVAHEIVELTMSEMRRERIALEEALAHGLPHVSGDRVQLQQVILNLIRNAADAIRESEGLPRLIRLVTQVTAGYVKLSVEDTGSGFDQNVAEQMFNSFFSTKPDGMGIGLSVSQSIVIAHGGSLIAVNNAGRGATFSFLLPVARLDDLHE